MKLRPKEKRKKKEEEEKKKELTENSNAINVK